MSSSQDRVGRVVNHKDYYLRGGDLNVLVSPRVFIGPRLSILIWGQRCRSATITTAYTVSSSTVNR